MPKAEPVTLIFQREQETRNKFRFQEMDPMEGNAAASPTPRERAVMEKIYLTKAFLKKKGNPDTVRVTIDFP